MVNPEEEYRQSVDLFRGMYYGALASSAMWIMLVAGAIWFVTR